MTTNNSKVAEKELYEPIRKYLDEAFRDKFGRCYLEITSDGSFSELLKSAVRRDIVFSFLGRKASPDLTGFIASVPSPWTPSSRINVQDFITVEIKREKIRLQDIYQAKMYGDLFQAKYSLLISPEEIPQEIVRLHQQLFVLYRFMGSWGLYIGEWDSHDKAIYEWLPESPI